LATAVGCAAARRLSIEVDEERAVALGIQGGGGPWFDVAKPLFSKAPTCVDGV